MIFYSYPIRSYFTLIVRFHSLYLKNGIQMELAKNKYLKQLRMKQALWTYHKSFKMSQLGQKISSLGSEGIFSVSDVEAGDHGGRVQGLTVVISRTTLARVSVIRRPDLISDLLPENCFRVLTVVATVILRMEAFGRVRLAEAEADDGQDQDWEDLNVDDHHFCGWFYVGFCGVFCNNKRKLTSIIRKKH